LGEKRAWAYPRTAQIFGVPPIISGTGKATNLFGTYIHRVHLHPNKCPLKFGRKKRVGVSPIISGAGKATNCKFGRYIHRVHPNKSPLKIWKKRERGSIQGLPKFLEYPLLSQERVKLRASNLAGIFTGSIRAKASEKFGRKGSVDLSMDFSNFWSTPYYFRDA